MGCFGYVWMLTFGNKGKICKHLPKQRKRRNTTKWRFSQLSVQADLDRLGRWFCQSLPVKWPLVLQDAVLGSDLERAKKAREVQEQNLTRQHSEFRDLPTPVYLEKWKVWWCKCSKWRWRSRCFWDARGPDNHHHCQLPIMHCVQLVSILVPKWKPRRRWLNAMDISQACAKKVRCQGETMYSSTTMLLKGYHYSLIVRLITAGFVLWDTWGQTSDSQCVVQVLSIILILILILCDHGQYRFGYIQIILYDYYIYMHNGNQGSCWHNLWPYSPAGPSCLETNQCETSSFVGLAEAFCNFTPYGWEIQFWWNMNEYRNFWWNKLVLESNIEFKHHWLPLIPTIAAMFLGPWIPMGSWSLTTQSASKRGQNGVDVTFKTRNHKTAW